MTTTVVSEAVARPVRGLVQAVPAAAVTEFVDAFIYNMDERQYAAMLVLLTLVFNFLQVLVENHIGKGLLRSVPPKVVPVVDNNNGV